MSSPSFEDLGSYIIGRSTHSSFSFLIKLKLSSQPKISNFHIHVIIQEYVCHLKVSVDNLDRMQVFDSLDKLHHESLDFDRAESFSSSNKIA
jgi:hypothetical protein